MTGTVPTAIDEALARAVVFRVLSLGFQAPTPEHLREIAADDGFPAVVAALEHLSRDKEDADLARAASRLATTERPDVERVYSRFVRLFGHTARGPIAACETDYGPDNIFNQPQQLADIAGYYLAFGLCPSCATEARVDHIACELEFMDFLNRKQAMWLASRPTGDADVETMEATRQAERTFLERHLGRFGRALATRVTAEDPDGYFGALGQALFAMITAECARVGVEPGPVDLAVRPDVRDDAPMACGSAEELIQIRRRP
jgi:TorA maturation chaperone TorD